MRIRCACFLVAVGCSLEGLAAQVAVPPGAAAVHDIRPGPGVTAWKMLSA